MLNRGNPHQSVGEAKQGGLRSSPRGCTLTCFLRMASVLATALTNEPFWLASAILPFLHVNESTDLIFLVSPGNSFLATRYQVAHRDYLQTHVHLLNKNQAPRAKRSTIACSCTGYLLRQVPRLKIRLLCFLIGQVYPFQDYRYAR